MSDNIKRNIKHIVKKLNVEHHFIKPIMAYNEILNVSCEGNIMPCSLCNPIIVNSVIEYAKNSDISIVFFGDSITISYNSISFINPYNILRVNLPEAMALTKVDMKNWSLTNYI